jgi:hypothetical protein
LQTQLLPDCSTGFGRMIRVRSGRLATATWRREALLTRITRTNAQ